MSTCQSPCCMPLDLGIYIMAVVDAMLNMIFLIVSIVVATEEMDTWHDSSVVRMHGNKYSGKEAKFFGKASVILFIIWLVIYICWAAGVIFPVKNRNRKGCNIWTWISIVFFAIVVIFDVIYFFTSDFNEGYTIVVSVYSVAYWIFKSYEIWVVKVFTNQLKGEKKEEEERAIFSPSGQVDGQSQSGSQVSGSTVSMPNYLQQATVLATTMPRARASSAMQLTTTSFGAK